MRRFLAMIGTIALISGLVVAAQPAFAAQSGTLTWQAPQRTDPPRGLNSISCVSKTLCRAGGASDQILRWDGHTWQNGDRFPDDAAGIDGMSCTSTQFCAAMELVHVASNRIAYRPVTRNTDDTWNLSAPTHLLANPRFPGYNSPIPDPVSCVSATFCMLITADDGYQIWNGKTWTSPVVFQKETVLRYTDVSCASATMCVAVGDTHWSDKGKTVYSWNGKSWSGPRYIPFGNFVRGLSCPTTTFCMAINGARWVVITPSHISALKAYALKDSYDVSCTSSTFCMAIGAGGSINWNGKSWSGEHHFTTQSPGTISCASSSFCVALTDEGTALDRVDGTWQKPRTVQKGITVGYGSGTYARNDVSCGSEQLCVLSDDSSATFGYDGTSWSGPHVISPLTGRVAVSCVNDAFCAAGSTDGLVQFRRDGHWSSATKVVSDDDQGVAAISCVSTTFCGLRDSYGGFYVWNGSRWSMVGKPRSFNYGNTLSCVADGCVYTLDDGSRSGDGPELAQTYAYSISIGTLTSVGAEIPSPTSISCTSLTFCLNSGYSTAYGGPSSGVEQFDGTSWQPVTTADGGTVDGSDVSCTSSSFCVVVGGRWESTWDGTQLSAEQQILDVPVVSGEYLDAVSCRPTLCVAASTGGWTIEAHQE